VLKLLEIRSHSKFEGQAEGRKEGRMYYCGGPKQEQAAVYSTDARDCKIATGYIDRSRYKGDRWGVRDADTRGN
jgi:hypothetical protein